MPPALRALVQVRLQAAAFMPRLGSQGHSCLALSQFGQNSATQSASDATCMPHVDHFVMRSASAHPDSLLDFLRRQDVKLPFSHVHHVKKQNSHFHTSCIEDTSLSNRDDAASASAPRLEKVSCALSEPLKPCVLSQQNAPEKRSQGDAQHTCNANDLPFTSATDITEALHPATPSQAPHPSARCKGQKESAALELLRRKLSLLELEQVSLCDASTLRKSRAFKSTSFEHLAAQLKVLKELLGSGEKACRALAMNPGVLLQPIGLLERKLKVFADFGITEDVVRKLCTVSRVLPRKVESLHKALSLFEQIGLDVASRNRILRVRPGVLLVRESSILNMLDFFKSLGMTGKEINCALCLQPTHLTVSVEYLREKYNFFQKMGFTMNEVMRLTWAHSPLPSIEAVKAKINLLKDQGFSDNDVHVLLLQIPTLFRISDKTLKSKLDFLLCEQNYDRAHIVKWARCLTYSLQGRLIPRLQALKQKGLSKVYPLSTILTCNDRRFEELGSKRKDSRRAVFSW